jgi:alkylation response protein AidB-like acyl-CoA dehydrogenase
MPYFDLNLDLTWEDKEIKASAHKFAKEVMRPIAREVDRMSAEDAVAKNSPLWEFLRQAYALGYHKALFPPELGGLGSRRCRVTSSTRRSSGEPGAFRGPPLPHGHFSKSCSPETRDSSKSSWCLSARPANRISRPAGP